MRTGQFTGYFLLLAICIANVMVAKGQVKLEIDICNLQNNKGAILIDFRDENDNFLAAFTGKVSDNKSKIAIENLRPGKYSFRYFHDENNNHKLDKYWIGVPKEGYGFSNKAKGKFGPPPFSETVFEVKNDTLVKCEPVYVNF